MTIDIIERADGKMAVNVKTVAGHATALEASTAGCLQRILAEVVLPGLIKHTGGTPVYIGPADQLPPEHKLPGDN